MTDIPQKRQTVVGIDVGENSVGLAAIELDQSGMPVRIPHLLTVIHDSGRDVMQSSSTGSVSRKASGGEARRARRLLRNRRRRSRRLEAELSKRNWPIIEPESLDTYDEWRTRLALLDGFIDDEVERTESLSIAIRHMANHRGWANAWVPIDQYVWKEEPSPEFLAAVESAREQDRFTNLDGIRLAYQADLAGLGMTNTERLRPRNPSRPSPSAPVTAHLLGAQRRTDVVREWRQICRTQQVEDDVFLDLSRIAFGQEKPRVPVENVGKDWLPGFQKQLRASVASLEHQEFQIRQTAANLSIRERPFSRERIRLTVEQQNLVVDNLMAVVDRSSAPSWKDVAEQFLGVSPNLLVHTDPEQSLGGAAPTMRSLTTLNELPSKHPVKQWWIRSTSERRSDFILWLADSTGTVLQGSNEFEELFEALDEKQLEAVARLKFPSGRSAHSIEALRLMSNGIRETGDTYVEVRNRLFGEGKDLRPVTLQTLDTSADHPTLQRVLPIVRRFLHGVDRSLPGAPSRVVVEHVRSALLGFNAKKELAMEQGKNRKARERAQQDIEKAGLGVSNASDGEIKKFMALQRQGSACLYCGGTISWSSCQLDHIVPRKTGGNNTRANLVAVCETCNQAKGKDTFRVFVESGRRPAVTLDGAVDRVDSMNRGEIAGKTFAHIKREMKRRLKQREEDEPIDERSLASTAYAATEMVDRIKVYYDDPTGRVAKVYSGRIVSMARHASGIDKRIRIRDGISVKSRFDRRHHAVDAAVAAMITPAVARVLAQRADLRDAARVTGVGDDWKRFAGDTPAARQAFARWKLQMERLAELVETQVRDDQAVVMQPVRFSSSHAALHNAGRTPHKSAPVGSAWTASQRALIVDDRVYEALSADFSPVVDMPEDPARTVLLTSGKRLGAGDPVFLFPDKAARIPLRNRSSAELGQSMHHARLYRWLDQRGRRQAAFVRLWASDLYDLEGGVTGDLLTAPLRQSSRAARRASGKLREALWGGVAEHVGTLMVGDEILIDPQEWVGENEPGRFLAEWPERHWRLAGLMSESQFTLTPQMLSQEGAVKVHAGTENRDPRLVVLSDLAYKVVSDRLTITSSALYLKPSTRVVRRTALGAIREGGGSGLPFSWSPFDAVNGQ